MDVDITYEIFDILNAPFGENVLASICSGVRKVFNALVEIKRMEG